MGKLGNGVERKKAGTRFFLVVLLRLGGPEALRAETEKVYRASGKPYYHAGRGARMHGHEHGSQLRNRYFAPSGKENFAPVQMLAPACFFPWRIAAASHRQIHGTWARSRPVFPRAFSSFLPSLFYGIK